MNLQDFACACSDLIHGGELAWDRPDGLNILYQQIKKRVKCSWLHFDEAERRGIKKIPKVTKKDIKNGWDYNFEFLEKISRRAFVMGFKVGVEETEGVISALEKEGYLNCIESKEEV